MTTMTTLLGTQLDSPAGPLAVILDEAGTVRAAGFAPLAHMAARLSPGLRAAGVREVTPDELTATGPGPAAVVAAVRAYSAGDLRALDEVPVAQPGGPFTQDAWAQMRAVPGGSTVTYAGLAAAAGRPAAVRAAGSACARNLIAPFVPCHRVLRTGGSLGGYYYGLDVKRALLAHEERFRVDAVG
ncbi:methylated-DNA--[protein]-cysteine S-methyltransferase [Cellulomonas hominis]